MDRSDPPASREIRPAHERTIEEIKVEAQERAERGAYPLIGLDPADVREALGRIKTRDPDEWAAAWSAVAERYYMAAAGSASRSAQTLSPPLEVVRIPFEGKEIVVTIRNKDNVLALYDLMINRKKSEEAAARFVSPVYIQHNPLIADGSEALGKYFGQ
jgi:hypothetical protein